MASRLDILREEPRERRLGRIATVATLLVAVTSLGAVAVDLVRSDGLPLVADHDYRDDILVPCPENVREAGYVAVDALPADGAGLTFVDARTPGEFLAGHIPGALSIPHRTLHTGDAEFRAAIARDLEPLAGLPGDRIVVCGDDRVGSGRDLAAVLLENGFGGVRYLEGGCAAWEKAGRPFRKPEAGTVAARVDELPRDLAGLTVVDARLARSYRRGHIPGAIQIPYRMLDGSTDERLAPLRGLPGSAILLYGSVDHDEGQNLARVLAASGWPGVRYVEGGFEAWEAAGRPVEPPPSAGGGGEP